MTQRELTLYEGEDGVDKTAGQGYREGQECSFMIQIMPKRTWTSFLLKPGQPLWSPVPLCLPFARQLSQRMSGHACSCSTSSGAAAGGLPDSCTCQVWACPFQMPKRGSVVMSPLKGNQPCHEGGEILTTPSPKLALDFIKDSPKPGLQPKTELPSAWRGPYPALANPFPPGQWLLSQD